MGKYTDLFHKYKEHEVQRESFSSYVGITNSVKINSMDQEGSISSVVSNDQSEANLRNANLMNLLSEDSTNSTNLPQEDKKTSVGGSPAFRGRDPMAHRGTDKARFFRGDWRAAWPPDFRPYRRGN